MENKQTVCTSAMLILSFANLIAVGFVIKQIGAAVERYVRAKQKVTKETTWWE